MNKKQIKSFVHNNKGYKDLNSMLHNYISENSSLPSAQQPEYVETYVVPEITVYVYNSLDFDLVIEGLMN